MKHIYSIIMSASLSLALIGCSDSGVVDVQTDAESLAASGETAALGKSEVKYVPYKERGSSGPTTDPRADRMDCDADEFEILTATEATVSGLGNVMGFDNLCADFTIGQSRVSTVYIAANGDEIYKSAVCNLVSPTDFVCEITIVGGTGRFANASTPPGEPILKTGTFDAATGGSVWTAEGRITSVGSSN